ncbi:MAG: hypothetical protein ACYSR3_15375 [Planctomycetota bacterium]|jgi:hypothetical protein
MDGIKLPDMFTDTCNCAYTTTSGSNVNVSLAALAKLMSDIPELPRIYKMDLKLVDNHYLPPNTILISSDIAKAIEEVIENGC